MRTVGIVGSSGLLGTELGTKLETHGWRVVRISRTRGDIRWDYDKGHLDPEQLSNLDALISLSGEPLAQRWTPRTKARMWESRVDLTRSLSESLTKCETPPLVWLSASAIGIYGDTGDLVVDESALPGEGWVPDMGLHWEQAARPPQSTRVVTLRTGLVLSKTGGLLEQMKRPFQMGLGAPLGSGKQWMSWIHIDDWTALVSWLLDQDDVQGPVNLTAPQPVTNRKFSQVLAGALERPCWPVGVPGFVLRALLGDMAGLALEGQRVIPRTALDAGYEFLFPSLEPALKDILG